MYFFSQAQEKKYANDVTLKNCAISKYWRVFPSAPRRQEVSVDFEGLGNYSGYMAAMEDKGNICLSCDEIRKFPEFPIHLLTRGLLTTNDGNVEPFLFTPKTMWETVSLENLVGTWTEIEPDVYAWYNMDDNSRVSYVEERIFTFSSNNSGSCKTSVVFPSYAEAKGGDTYNNITRTWSRHISGGYYFTVESECKTAFKFNLDSVTITLNISSCNISQKVIDETNYRALDPEYGRNLKNQNSNDINTNSDVKKAKSFLYDWVNTSFSYKPQSSQKYRIFQIRPGIIALLPARRFNMSECIILQKND